MSNTREPLFVDCPTCKAKVEWSEASPQRPFCSERCRNKDFIGWANQEHRISGENDYDDLLSDDLPKI